MCVNYLPPRRQDLVDVFKVESPLGDWPAEAWPDYAAPIILPDDGGGRCALLANYGMLPKNRQPPGKSYSTVNARSETVGELRTYRSAWQHAQICLVPMLGFFEPCYESGRAVRWRIGMADGAPFAVAGLWRTWEEEGGGHSFSFTQLTVNSDQHPLMNRMHKPGDEKRSLVIVPPDQYDDWLSCRDSELARSFLTLYPAELMAAEPKPKPPSKKQASSP
jgi:putative SOS response-associated peptidase YedK